MKYPFPFLSAGLGLGMMLLQLVAGISFSPEGGVTTPPTAFLPPLLILLMNEFGMIVCTVGAFFAYKMLRGEGKPSTGVLLLVANLALACSFAYIGYEVAVENGVLDAITSGAAV